VVSRGFRSVRKTFAYETPSSETRVQFRSLFLSPSVNSIKLHQSTRVCIYKRVATKSHSLPPEKEGLAGPLSSSFPFLPSPPHTRSPSTQVRSNKKDQGSSANSLEGVDQFVSLASPRDLKDLGADSYPYPATLEISTDLDTMEDPFDTPTARPSNPINDALRAESANLDPLPPSRLSSPPLPPSERSRMRSPDTQTIRSISRMSQVRQNSFVSLPKKSISSPPPSSYSKASTGPMKRPVNDRTKRTSMMDSQSVYSQTQSRQPHVQDLPGYTPEELVRFAALCRRQYYEKDNEAGKSLPIFMHECSSRDLETARKVGELLAKLPPSSVAVFSRTMANIRSEYHRDKEIERRLHVETTLASILPGQTIKMALGVSLEDGIGGGVNAMRSSKARQARHQAFKAFIDTNCVKMNPGVHPFFRSLFAMLWLQSIEPGRGGAGPRRVEWELDVAVFSEAGGGEQWTIEAVEVLKGVSFVSDGLREDSVSDLSCFAGTRHVRTDQGALAHR